MFTFYRPQIKDQGSHIIRMTTGSIPNLTPNVTNIFGIGGISDVADTAIKQGHTAYVDEAFSAQQAVAITPGTLLLNIFKFDAVAGAPVSLATGFDLEAQVAGKSQRVPLLTTLTDTQRVMHFGDYLYISIVSNNAAISPQAVGLVVAVHIKLIT